jgi:hypothetical protein
VQSQNFIPLMLSKCIILTFFGCGSARDGGTPVATAGDGGSGTHTTAYSMAVLSDDELPPCAASNNKQLVYVKSTKIFKSCDDGQWTSIDINGKDGMTVVSNQLLQPHFVNLCTRYSLIENCFFTGGQIVKYSDGSVLLTGGYSYELYADDGTAVGEWDRMTSSITMLAPPETAIMWQRLDWAVSREGDDGRSLFMVFDRVNDRVILLYDSDNNAEPDITDEILLTVTKTAISG